MAKLSRFRHEGACVVRGQGTSGTHPFGWWSFDQVERIRWDQPHLHCFAEGLATNLAAVQNGERSEAVKQRGLPRGERFRSDVDDGKGAKFVDEIAGDCAGATA